MNAIQIVSYHCPSVRQLCDTEYGVLSMNYHTKDHEVVENSLTQALFELMNRKPFSEITITELVKYAGVGRATYYRNYTCKEEIIENYIYRLMMDFHEQHPVSSLQERFTEAHLIMVFRYIQPYIPLLTVLNRSGLGFLFLDLLNRSLLQIHQADIRGEKDRLLLLAFAGAEFNIIFTDLLNNHADQEELAEQISGLFLGQQTGTE